MKTRIMYVENKSNGDARIGRVRLSKTGKTLYYGDLSFRSLKGKGFKSNYLEVTSKTEYWISGPKRNGEDRLYGERVPIQIDADVRSEYWENIRGLPGQKLKVSTW